MVVVVEGVAGELAAIGGQVISSRQFRRDAEALTGLQKHPLLLPQIVVFGGHQKGEIQVPQIVEHRPAPGEPSGQVPALAFEEGCSALRPGVLILADDHGVLVLPEIEKAAPAFHGVQQVLLGSQVEKGVEGPAFIGQQSLGHALV